MITTRCSALDRNLVCGASMLKPQTPHNPQSPEGKEGTAGHEALAAMVRGEQVDFDQIASRYFVDIETLRFFVHRGRIIWDAISRRFIHARTEQPLSAVLGNVKLTGHTDVDSITEGSVLILDWKLGWSPSDHPYQLIGYATLAANEHQKQFGRPPDEIIASEVHIRGGTIETHRWNQDAINVFVDELNRQAKRPDQYGPGAACRYCPHQCECPGRDAWIRSSIQSISDSPTGGLTPAKIASLWEKSKELEKALQSYREIARQIVEESGPIDLGNGKSLKLLESKRDQIIPSRALKLMRKNLQLNRDDVDACVRISKGGLMQIVKDRVKAGQGAREQRKTMALLKEHDAVEETMIQKLTAVKRGKELKE